MATNPPVVAGFAKAHELHTYTKQVIVCIHERQSYCD